MANPTAGPAIRRHCMDCLGAETGGQAYDCASELCPLRVCQPWRGKLLPIGQRPKVWVPEVKDGDAVLAEGYYRVNYDETVEAARLADHLKRHPRRKPSGSLCSDMCRECMGVRVIPGMPEEQKGGGNRESCGKEACALWHWQPYKPGGVPKLDRSAKQVEAASKGLRALRSDRLTEAEKEGILAPGQSAQAMEPQSPLPLSL